jgi:hypothetical protein
MSSQQCKGTTAKGERCTRMTHNPIGLCSSHDKSPVPEVEAPPKPFSVKSYKGTLKTNTANKDKAIYRTSMGHSNLKDLSARFRAMNLDGRDKPGVEYDLPETQYGGRRRSKFDNYF